MRSFLVRSPKDPYYSGVRSQGQGKAACLRIVFGATGRSWEECLPVLGRQGLVSKLTHTCTRACDPKAESIRNLKTPSGIPH